MLFGQNVRGHFGPKVRTDAKFQNRSFFLNLSFAPQTGVGSHLHCRAGTSVKKNNLRGTTVIS